MGGGRKGVSGLFVVLVVIPSAIILSTCPVCRSGEPVMPAGPVHHTDGNSKARRRRRQGRQCSERKGERERRREGGAKAEPQRKTGLDKRYSVLSVI